ncbi:MAG TPA: OsmC family protein [Acetobacteraceae bacterium]|nr:OsmC family protein [Acetobacteraceae bacterium]
MGNHEATVRWRRRDGEVFTDRRYGRGHEWAFDGGARVRASASPDVVRVPYSDPAGVDPEEALIAALASCHMLFFLDYAAQAGFVITSYEDRAVGTMAKREDGQIWMSQVALRPHVLFAGEKRPTEAEVATLHHKAHEACYIANSVRTEIRIEGQAEGIRA